MKKRLPIFCVFLLMTTLIFGQTPKLSKFSFSLEYKMKLDRTIKKDNNPESLNYVEDREPLHTGAILVQYRFAKGYSIESGYSFEPFVKGYALQIGNFVHSTSDIYLLAHVIPIRVTYNNLGFNLFKRPLRLEPTLGGSIGFRYNDGDRGDGVGTRSGPSLSLVEPHRAGIEYNVNKLFFLLEARTQLSYQFTKYISFYFGGGYNLGLNTIGRVNATYVRPPSTVVMNINKTSKGSSIYFNGGFRFRLRQR